jgi:hypothetical protein
VRVTFDGVLLQTLPQSLLDTLVALLSFIPRIVAALVILLLGWVLGRVVSLFIRRAGRAVKLERRTMNTLLGRALDRPGAILRLCGMAGAFYVYLIAFLAALDVLGLSLFAEWTGQALFYLPSLFGGALLIVVGFALAEFIRDTIERTLGDEPNSEALANGTCALLYLVVIVLGLGTMGVDIGILSIVLAAFAGAVGLAIGVGAGLAIGFGGWPYVAANIDDWMNEITVRTNRDAPETSPETRAGRSGTSPETVGYRPVEDR